MKWKLRRRRPREPLPGAKPRIAVVTSVQLAIEAFWLELLRELSDIGEITVITSCNDPKRIEMAAPVSVFDLPINRKPDPFRDLVVLVRLVSEFRRESYGLVLSQTPKAGLLAMLAAKIARVPYREHTFTGQVWATRTGVTRWLLRFADKVTATCATSIFVDGRKQMEFLFDERVVSRSKGRVLGSGSLRGVDVNTFGPSPSVRKATRATLGIGDDEFVVLYLGRFVREKGLRELVSACCRLATSNPVLWLVLVGPDEENLAEELTRLALGSTTLRFHIEPATRTPAIYMQMADLFVLPSHREGFPSSVLEAGAAGLPTVGTDILGMRDAVEDGSTGVLVPVGDPEKLAEAIGRFRDDANYRSAFSERSLRRVRNDFSSAEITRLRLEHYRQVIGESSFPPGE